MSVGEAVDADGLAGPQHQVRHALWLDRVARPGEQVVAFPPPGGDRGHGLVGFVAGDVRAVGSQHPADLLGDRGEHLGRRDPASHEGGDAAERGLLVQEPIELVAVFLQRARHAVERALQQPDLVDATLGQAHARSPPAS
jgi:hypothetical protein